MATRTPADSPVPRGRLGVILRGASLSLARWAQSGTVEDDTVAITVVLAMGAMFLVALAGAFVLARPWMWL